MRIGVSGHQARPGLDWDWTSRAVLEALTTRAPVHRAFTSLAVGSDQVFARAALEVGIPVVAVIPCTRYDRFFQGADRDEYLALLGRCEAVHLPDQATDERSFLVAGQYVADHSDLLIAIWDGEPAAGVGGTADIVRYCGEHGRPVLHLNPIERTKTVLDP